MPRTCQIRQVAGNLVEPSTADNGFCAVAEGKSAFPCRVIC